MAIIPVGLNAYGYILREIKLQLEDIQKYITPPVNQLGCKRWLRSHNGEGRASYVHQNKRKLVTRFLLEKKLNRSLLPTELACHSCDNPWCVEVEHLWVGCSKTNMEDKVKKNRQHKPIGITHGRAKLSDQDIINIRADKRFEKIIAEEYGVSKSLIGQIKRRECWRHL